MTNKHLRLAAGLAVALVLVASACSDDASNVTAGSAAADQSTAPGAAVTTPAPADSAMAAESDIVDTAIAAGDFTTLVAAVRAAGLEDTLPRRRPVHRIRPDRRSLRSIAPRHRRHSAGRPDG